MQFFNDITNIAKTRKFWVGLGGAIVTYLVTAFSSVEGAGLVMSILTALGVYQAPNSTK